MPTHDFVVSDDDYIKVSNGACRIDVLEDLEGVRVHMGAAKPALDSDAYHLVSRETEDLPLSFEPHWVRAEAGAVCVVVSQIIAEANGTITEIVPASLTLTGPAAVSIDLPDAVAAVATYAVDGAGDVSWDLVEGADLFAVYAVGGTRSAELWPRYKMASGDVARATIRAICDGSEVIKDVSVSVNAVAPISRPTPAALILTGAAAASITDPGTYPADLGAYSVDGTDPISWTITDASGLFALSVGAPTARSATLRMTAAGATGTTYTVTVQAVSAGQTLTRQVAVTYSAAAAAPTTTITSTAGGTVQVDTTATEASLTFSGTARFDGTYTVATADLTDPVQLVAPLVAGTTAVGDVLTVDPGLWAYDVDGGDPTITHQWQRDGADIAGATGTTYTLVAADQGASITCVETAADSDGSRSAVSNAIAVPAAPSTTSYDDNFDGYADGTVLSDQAAYTRLAGSGTKATVSSGKLAVRAVGGAAETIRRAEDLPANQFAEAVLANTPDASNRLFLYLRYGDPDNWYRVRASGGRYDVQKKVSGTESYTTGGYNAATSPAAGDVVRLSVTGDTLTFTLTRGGVDTVKTITDTSLTSGQPAVGFQNYGSVSAVAEVDQLTVGEV